MALIATAGLPHVLARAAAPTGKRLGKKDKREKREGSARAGIRVQPYPQAQLLQEAAQLLELEDKIEHPPNGGTEDTTDAAAAAFFSAITSDEIRSLGVPQTPPVVEGI